MNRTTTMVALAGLLGASIFLGAPETARADQGKWWTPKSDAREAAPRRVERRTERRVGRRDARSWDRQWRTWSGGRVYRDVIVIRRGDRGPGYRAWRYYSYPDYRYQRHVVYVRPVRYCVSVGATVGSVHLRARINDPDDFLYGCNFCDARFSDFGAYRAHLYECPHRPAGFQVVAQDWDDHDWGGASWWEDHNWNDDEGYDN